MDAILKEQFIKAMLSSKKMLMYTAATSGIPFAEIMILMHISRLAQDEKINAGVRVSRIKDQTHISLPAVSQQLSTLEHKGFIERNITAKDRRITLVSLTPTGCDILKTVREQTDIILDKLALRVGEENIRQYIKLSTKIMESLDEMQGITA